MNDALPNDSKQQRQRECNRRWFQAHPDYPYEYRAKQRQHKAELGVAMNGTLPVKVSKKIAYTVNITRPLKPHERVQRPQHQRRSHHASTIRSRKSVGPAFTENEHFGD